VLQFITPLESIYNKNLGLIEQKCIFEHYRDVQTIEKHLLNVIIFVMIFFSGELFRAALYRLLLVLLIQRCAGPLKR